jgi:ribonuclease HIII
MPMISIDLNELENLKDYIIKTGLKRVKSNSKYELLRIKDGEVSIVVYKSGKVVFNDTMASRKVIDSILKIETKFDFILGSDEVGKGEWYGPLITACVALTPNLIDKFRKLGVRDSKTINKKKISFLAQRMIKEDFVWKYTMLTPSTFNKMFEAFKKENKSLNELLAWAHARAIRETLDTIKNKRARLVIDKFDVEKTYRRLYGVDKSKLEIVQKSEGESEIPVAVASIIAKDMFERWVDRFSRKLDIDIRNVSPRELPESILKQVGKIHFKNVR